MDWHATLGDAKIFVLRNRAIIEEAPLQVYYSALISSPSNSIIRRLFQAQISNWIYFQPNVPETWGSLLQTLEGHSSSVCSVAFSPDGYKIVSGSDDHTVRVGDEECGLLLQTLEGHSSSVNSVAFSLDRQKIVSGSHDHTVRVWDAKAGTLLQTLEGHSCYVYSVAFSPEGHKIFKL